MTTLQAPPSNALDETAHTFIATFMAHVATVSGYGKNRLTTIAGIKTLLLAALEGGEGASSAAWRTFYRAIDDLVDASIYAHDTRIAYTYLRTFVQENADLADD